MLAFASIPFLKTKQYEKCLGAGFKKEGEGGAVEQWLMRLIIPVEFPSESAVCAPGSSQAIGSPPADTVAPWR